MIRASAVYGEGVQNYMNDAPIDIGIKNNFSDPRKPVVGKALPVLGLVAFLDHNWNKQFSTSIGYSYLDIDNTDGQPASDFHQGHYGLVNLLYYPVPGVMAGAEFQYGKRKNFTDGFSVGRLPDPVRGQVQLLVQAGEINEAHEAIPRRRRGPRARRGPRPVGSRPDTRGLPEGHRRGLREIQGPPGRQERRLHPGAREGRPEDLRHRARDDGRQGLHGGRPQVRGLDPVHLEGLHDGEGRRGVGLRRDRQHDRRRRDRHALQLDRRRSSSPRRPSAGRR